MGTFAIQFAKHLGPTVASTGEANIDLIPDLGADVIVDYKEEDFEAKLSDYDFCDHGRAGTSAAQTPPPLALLAGTLNSPGRPRILPSPTPPSRLASTP
jgi:hypothetical protein